MHLSNYLQLKAPTWWWLFLIAALIEYSTVLRAQSPHWAVRSGFFNSGEAFPGNFSLSEADSGPLQLAIFCANQYGLPELTSLSAAAIWHSKYYYLGFYHRHWPAWGAMPGIEAPYARHTSAAALQLTVANQVFLYTSVRFRVHFDQRRVEGSIGLQRFSDEVAFGVEIQRLETIFMSADKYSLPGFSMKSWFSKRLDGEVFGQGGLQFRMGHPPAMHVGLAYQGRNRPGWALGLHLAFGEVTAVQSWEFGFSTGPLPQFRGNFQLTTSLHPSLGWSNRLLYTIELKQKP